MTRVGIATGYDCIIEPLAKTPEPVTVEIMNPKSMFCTREEAIEETTGGIDENTSDVNLIFQHYFEQTYLEKVRGP